MSIDKCALGTYITLIIGRSQIINISTNITLLIKFKIYLRLKRVKKKASLFVVEKIGRFGGKIEIAKLI